MKETLHNYSAVSAGGTGPAAAAPPAPLLHNRDFLIASAARFLSSVGYGAVVVSIMLHLQSSLGSTRTGVWAVTLYLLLSTIPSVLLAPWAGRLADTRDSRHLAVAASLTSAATVGAMALSLGLFSNYVPALFALTLVLEAALAVASPTWTALLPRIVGEERTPKAMGTMQATLMLAQLAGPAAGGILVGTGGTVFSFWSATGCYLVLAAGAWMIHTRRAPDHHSQANPRLLDGLRILNQDTLLWAIVCGALFVILGGEAVNVLDIFLARDALGATAAQYGLLAATMAAGMVAGSLAAGNVRTEKHRLALFLFSIAGTAAMLNLMGLAPTLTMLYIYGAVAGAWIGALNATFGALLIMRTPEPSRGQVSAIATGLTRAVSIGALGLGGLLGSLFGPRTGFVICGSATLVVAAVLTAVIVASRPALDVPPEVRPGAGSHPAPGSVRQPAAGA